MLTNLEEANRAIENVRSRLALAVAEKEIDIELGWELLHEMQELTKRRDELAEIHYALGVLRRHGVAFKVWAAADVYSRLNQFPELTVGDKEKIVHHVIEGDDWGTMSEETAEDDANIWAIIKGTAGDHPEWFPGSVRDKL